MMRIVFLALILLPTVQVQAQSPRLVAPPQADEATAGSAGRPVPEPATPAIYLTADEMPAFPGGAAALSEFYKKYLNYPEAALNRSVSGKVYVTFVVDDKGRLHDPRVVKGLGSGLDEEAVRLVRLMPWWVPGKLHGAPVWVSLTIPISFRVL